MSSILINQKSKPKDEWRITALSGLTIPNIVSPGKCLRVNEKKSEVLSWLVYMFVSDPSIKNELHISCASMAAHLNCHRTTITRLNSFLKDSGLVNIRESRLFVPGEGHSTTLYFSMNWDRLMEAFGAKLFNVISREFHAKILSKVKAVSEALYDAFCVITTTTLPKSNIINNIIFSKRSDLSKKRSSSHPKKKDISLKTGGVIQRNILKCLNTLKGLVEMDSIFKRCEGEVVLDSSLDAKSKKRAAAIALGSRIEQSGLDLEAISPEWYSIALRVGIHPEHILAVFESFVHYWSEKNGSAALKKNWKMTWIVWARNQIGYQKSVTKCMGEDQRKNIELFHLAEEKRLLDEKKASYDVNAEISCSEEEVFDRKVIDLLDEGQFISWFKGKKKIFEDGICTMFVENAFILKTIENRYRCEMDQLKLKLALKRG